MLLSNPRVIVVPCGYERELKVTIGFVDEIYTHAAIDTSYRAPKFSLPACAGR